MSSPSSTSQSEQQKWYDPTLRSKESVERAFLLLTNTTQRAVDVYWINYACQLIRYATIEPDGRVPLNTYSTHPWIFCDKRTGLKMHVNHQEVFWPEPCNQAKPIRVMIPIHFPIQKLTTIAAWKIVVRIETDEQLNQLEIPRILLLDLKRIRKDYLEYKQRRTN